MDEIAPAISARSKPEMTPKYGRIFRMALTGAYAAIPLALALGTYQGWTFQSSMSNTNIPVVGPVGLIATTALAEDAVQVTTGRYEPENR
jgi:hypothetical protein